MSGKRFLALRVYRSLLKAAKPFRDGMMNGNISAPSMNCLLHRTGRGDETWNDFLRGLSPDDLDNTALSREERVTDGKMMFDSLLREVVSGSESGIRQMQWPKNTDSNRLYEVIRREFRDQACMFTEQTRLDVAFRALRELNKKISFATSRARIDVHPHQAASGVFPLPLDSPESYLRPGSYLVAHPSMVGYFRRTVICILDHKDEATQGGDSGESEKDMFRTYGTYGLVINRPSESPTTGKTMSLVDAFRRLPTDINAAFGNFTVNKGGPVHMTLQMIYSATSEQNEENEIKGTFLKPIDPEGNTDATDNASGKGVYYNGDLMKAGAAVTSGKLDNDDVSFFVGASCWSPTQLENEVALGCWLPCAGPTEIAQKGICDHETSDDVKARPKADLWLSMMSSCGEEEAKLAHLLFRDDARDENGDPCDLS